MPAPTSHTESSLISFLETELGPVGASLGLLETDALLQAVYGTERVLRHAVTAETDMAKLETIATWRAWLAAEAAATEAVDLKAGSVGLTRSQLFDHIRLRLARAEAAALAYPEAQAAIAGGGVAVVGATTTVGSPYGWAAYPEFGA
jgi:hypothetical protein